MLYGFGVCLTLCAVTRGSYNVILAFEGAQWNVERFSALDKNLHPQISPEELEEAEVIVKMDARIQELAKAVGGLITKSTFIRAYKLRH